MPTKGTKKLIVKNIEIRMTVIEEEDYISLTDMVSDQEGDAIFRNWLRNRNTLEYLGLWEQMHNENFKLIEFDQFRIESGKNTFSISAKKWIESTNAIGIVSKQGRYGGTYAHKDIAFKFATWISPEFELFMVKDYQRLKSWENSEANQEWSIRRLLSKVNYRLQTDAIEACLVPFSKRPKEFVGIEFAQEADMLNMVIFGVTAKEWKSRNPEKANAGMNIRDDASIIQLTILANMESLNALMIKDSIPAGKRFEKLVQYAQNQLEVLLKDARLQSLDSQQRLQHHPDIAKRLKAKDK